MDLSITGDGYIKCLASKTEHIEAEQISLINASNLSLPCMKDRYEEKVLFYHIGDHISIAEYLKNSVLDFEQLKELAMNLAEVFLGLEENELSGEKVISDMEYVFISPHTQQMKIIQCPITEYGETGNYQKIMSSICRNVHSQNAFVMIGYIMEEINKPDFKLEKFEQMLGEVKNVDNKTAVKKSNTETVIQKQVVEKQIIRNKTSYLLCGILAVTMEIATGIIFPLLFEELDLAEGDYLNYYSVLLAGVLTVILFTIFKLTSGKDSIESVRNLEPVIQQPIKQMTQKTFINDNAMDMNRQKQPVKSQQLNQNRYNAAPKKQEPVEKREQPDLEKTGILEGEVEINPLKRQEMYNKNSIPTAYLIEEATNKKFEIKKNNYTVGRGSMCDLTVNNSIVSKEHANIIYKSGEYFLKDLKSSNFTYLNKAQIEPEELYKIEDGSRIGFGNQWYIFKTSL